MKKLILLTAIVASAATFLSSCEEYDEVPPTQVQKGTSYKLPDPTPLTQEDRAVIAAMEKEYNGNAK